MTCRMCSVCVEPAELRMHKKVLKVTSKISCLCRRVRPTHHGIFASSRSVRRAHPTLLLAVAVATLAGCSTTGNKTPSLSKTLSVITSPTARTLTSVARSSDPKTALKKSLESRKSVYETNPYALVQDMRTLKRDYDNLVTLLTGKVKKTWGKKEEKLPSRVQYIKYTQNYMSRAVVDFDAGLVTVETLDDKDPRTSLKNAIVTTLLTPNDPRAVDLFSDSAITLTSEKEPYLLGLVVDQNKKQI